MEIKLCRLCGHNGQDFTHIFKTEGLKNKIETCLPIVVSSHCLLPETICPICLNIINNFYDFLKNCLQNIIILESQLDIQESCLKTKRKRDKSCYAALPLPIESKNVQTEDYLNVLLGDSSDINRYGHNFPYTTELLSRDVKSYDSRNLLLLVDYEVNSDTNSDDLDSNSNSGHVHFGEKHKSLQYFNDIADKIISRGPLKDIQRTGVVENSFIHEIEARKNLKKRRSDSIENTSTKICKLDSGNKRKCNKPKKVEKTDERNELSNDEEPHIKKEIDSEDFEYNNHELFEKVGEDAVDHSENNSVFSQMRCLLCGRECESPKDLEDHFLAAHSKETQQRDTDMVDCDNEGAFNEKKKKNLPNLVKISDLKRSESVEDESLILDLKTEDSPPPYPKITCPNCSTVFTTKSELFIHLQLKHSGVPTYLCGICLKQVNSVANLKSHVDMCRKNRPVSNRYYCEVCCFGEDNYRSLETHVLVHGFLLQLCRKEVKNFDPEDYILKNPSFVLNAAASPIKNLTCLDCHRSDFDSFRKFSVHRRNVHSIFHCDLCNKYYGRNSHLWKHVHRLHKGHPSITCQICFKTSASKYHLAQHFTKIHQLKTPVKKEENEFDTDSIPAKKNEECNIVSAKPTLKKQDSTTDQEHQNSSYDENTFSHSENENSLDVRMAPKEIDPSHDLYTNILTNYTPPKNEGDFKCPKCSKGFHKRMLLRKHKKNCRPKLQKDLLTRCKSCARIFKDRQSLAKHLVNYHSDYVCEICNEKVPSKCEIVTHIRFQHPSSHLFCSSCENILRCKKDLLEHLADHENSFVCQFCGDALSSKVKLKMHILSLHRKILSLSCGICLKLFENQHVLRNHVSLVHKDRLNPLTSCPICGKNYGSKWKTYDHVNKSHGRIFKACKMCLEIYESESQLESHIKTTHISQQVPLISAVKPNVAAILSTAIKSDGTASNLHNNQNDFDTDSEENTEETENNTQSSDSDDDENSRSDPPEEPKTPTAKTLSAFSSRESKISLLEKRLLGKTVAQPNIGNEKVATTYSHKQNPMGNTGIGVIKKDNSGTLKIKNSDENSACDKKNDGNPLIHHSKRTVYVNSNDPSFCEICHKTWPAKKHLWQHYIRCHKRVAATVCGICLKTNQNYESLQTHLRENHPTLLHGQGFGSNFICRICGRYHNASSKLSLHMVIHENFDWKLLDRFPPILRYQTNTKHGPKPNGRKRSESGGNGYKFEETQEKKEGDLLNGGDEMYDDMIEQVEESSSSSEAETGNKAKVLHSGSSTDSDDNNKASTESFDNGRQNKQPQSTESSLSFSNLLQTLKNHNQFQIVQILNEIRKDPLLSVPNTSKPGTPNDTSNNDSQKKTTNDSNIHTVEHKYALSREDSPTSKVASSSTNTTSILTRNSEYMGHSYLSEETSSTMSECKTNGGQDGGGVGDQDSQDDGRNSQSSVAEGEASQDSECSGGDEEVELKAGHSRNLLRPKSEELDSAIKSISDPCVEPQTLTDYNDISEQIQSNNCSNDKEIENAVGSIL